MSAVKDQQTPLSTVLFHDYFAIRGGGERLVLELGSELDAMLVFGLRSSSSYPIEDYTTKFVDLGARSIPHIPGLTSLGLLSAFSQRKEFASKFDVRIFSGVIAPFAAPEKSAPGISIFYCHTPPRFIYDQREFYAAANGSIKRLQVALGGPSFKRRYEQAVNRMDCVVANSYNVAQRIKTYLGADSIVVYPPVDTEGYVWNEPQGYYLSSARLTPLKRVAQIIDAFLMMPEKKLVVASGGDQEAELHARAAGAKNIEFTGWIDDAALKSLVSRSVATIYVPIEEDFGMSPVESMAAGKPVIGVAEGGLLETVIPGKTGVLLPRNPTPEDIVSAVVEMTPDVAIKMRSACIAQAQLFTRERFLKAMKEVINTTQAQKLATNTQR